MLFMNIGIEIERNEALVNNVRFYCFCDYMTLIQRYLHLTNSIRKKSRLLYALG